MKRGWLIFFICHISCELRSQPTSESEMLTSFHVRKQLAESSILKNYPVRNIGPTVQGGRIVDIDVNTKNTKEFFVGFASGGIFKTVNNGITFEPTFDHNDALGIGDFVLSQSDPNILYVGTGEKNSSRSSYAGSGVYKTTDGGKSWTHLGLAGTQHISRIILHPTDNNTVWVAAIGSLYSNNKDRGVYKSSDGGKTWRRTLFINDSTGVIDLVINPQSPLQMWASSWERMRRAGHFKGNGVASCIYRSDDGGETWAKSVVGFPQGKHVGRIGLEVSVSKPNMLYAILDNQGEPADKKEDRKAEKLELQDFKEMSKEDFLKLDAKKLRDFLKNNDFPEKYTPQVLKKEIGEGKYTPKAIAEYFGADANANLFQTKVIGAELYRSEDGGATWSKMNSYSLDGVFYTYGYYFSEMKISPDNPDLLYVYGVPLLKSRNGGVTWHRIDTLKGVRDVHVDHHALWINPGDSKHILLGNDGGLYQSYDEGANWLHLNNMPVGQFYTVNVDMDKPYNVYGGLQDNGVLRGSSQSIPNRTKHWVMLLSGDGMYVAPDPRDRNVVYMGYQFGNNFRLELDKKKSTKIKPLHDIGGTPLRWNWRTPLILSRHNPDIVYTGAQKVFRSLNKGESWEEISSDLTHNRKQGNVPLSTISSLAESPLKFGLLYAGTDDGNVWVSKSGCSWELIVNNLPANRWVSSISPSPHDESVVFISLNGYREDDFHTYIFMSKDSGKSWVSLKGNLPESVANIILQDPINPDLLYCGLDNGTYVSLDKGVTWHFFNGMLNVPAYDMIIHPRDNELVVATHGRSVFVADVKPLQSLKNAGTSKSILAFDPEEIDFNEKWGTTEYAWEKIHEPKAEILYYVGKRAEGIEVEVYDEKKNVIRKLKGTGSSGFHVLHWDLKIKDISITKKSSDKKSSESPEKLKYAGKGKYTIKFLNGRDASEVSLKIE